MAGRNGATGERATAPGVSPDTHKRALAEFGDLLGPEGLLTAAARRRPVPRSFCFCRWQDFEPRRC